MPAVISTDGTRDRLLGHGPRPDADLVGGALMGGVALCEHEAR
jgi:hypothetical protein